MIAIKDMEMPSCCDECMFCNHLKFNDYGSYGECIFCYGDKMNLLLHQKHERCPLVEIKEIIRKYQEIKGIVNKPIKGELARIETIKKIKEITND